MASRSQFDNLLASLRGADPEPSVRKELPVLPPVLEHELRDTMREGCKRFGSLAALQDARDRLSRGIAEAIARACITSPLTDVTRHLPGISNAQFDALNRFEEAIQKYLAFKAEGGAALYVSRSVAKEARRRQAAPDQLQKVGVLNQEEIQTSIETLGYESSSDKGEIRKVIEERHGISSATFHRALAQYRRGRKSNSER